MKAYQIPIFHLHDEHLRMLCRPTVQEDEEYDSIAATLWRYQREEALATMAMSAGRAVLVCEACIREDRARQLPVRYT